MGQIVVAQKSGKRVKPFYAIGYAVLISVVVAAIALFAPRGTSPAANAPADAASETESQPTTAVEDKAKGESDPGDTASEPKAVQSSAGH